MTMGLFSKTPEEVAAKEAAKKEAEQRKQAEAFARTPAGRASQSGTGWCAFVSDRTNLKRIDGCNCSYDDGLRLDRTPRAVKHA